MSTLYWYKTQKICKEVSDSSLKSNKWRGVIMKAETWAASLFWIHVKSECQEKGIQELFQFCLQFRV